MWCNWFISDIQQEHICTWYVKLPQPASKKHIYQNHKYVKGTVCCPSTLWYFCFYFIPWRWHCWQGHTVFVFYLFWHHVTNNYVFFIVFYCKGVLNTRDCVMNNALNYDRSLLIHRDYFLRIGFAFGCMYFCGTLLWKCRCSVFFITLFFLGKFCLAHLFHQNALFCVLLL